MKGRRADAAAQPAATGARSGAPARPAATGGGSGSGGRSRPTLEMVAARAGVSRATVSRVVNGSTAVAPEIREAVMRAVEALGYVPNLAARSLVTQRTDSYALVVPEPTNRVFSEDPFFSILIRGVSEELEKADKQLVLMLANSATSHDRVERYAMAGHVDGVMCVSMHGADPLPVTLTRLGVPVVCNERPLGRLTLPYVGVDNIGGARAATRHLLDAGRTRVATVAGPLDMVGGIDRLAGYRAALKSTKNRPILAVGDFTRESGVAAMRQLLDTDPDIDGVFVANDLMADGALRALRQAGRRVPDDVAVVGFDDIELARFTEPPLTTVRQPILSIGRELARMATRLAAGEEISSVILPTELIIRESA